MPEYRPGRWRYDDRTATVDDERGVPVCGVNVTEQRDWWEHAHLLAAAPSLLVAARHALAHMRAHERTAGILGQTPWYVASVPDPMDWLERAICEAEGKGDG